MRQLLATLGKKAPMSTEKTPQSWTKACHLEAIMIYHGLNDELLNSYYRESGIYPHPAKECKSGFYQKIKTLPLPSGRYKWNSGGN